MGDRHLKFHESRDNLLAVSLAVGLLALTAVAAYQVSAIIRHPHSAVRAIEALAITVPLFLLLFAATYFLMAQADAGNFNVHSLTRTDSLYSRSPSSPRSASETSARPAKRAALLSWCR